MTANSIKLLTGNGHPDLAMRVADRYVESHSLRRDVAEKEKKKRKGKKRKKKWELDLVSPPWGEFLSKKHAVSGEDLSNLLLTRFKKNSLWQAWDRTHKDYRPPILEPRDLRNNRRVGPR